MQKEERQKYIIERLSKDSRVFVTQLSQELSVSDDTLRRDLSDLENLGLLTKVHGGAIARSEISLKFMERLNTSTIVKQQMAAKLVPLFNDGDVILIDGGTSNLEVARQLATDKKFTVFTNCLPIALELSSHGNVDLTMIGGRVLSASQNTLGVSAFRTIHSIYPDWVIVGVSDIHPQKGLTTDDREEAILKRSMILQGGKRVVIAGSEKLGTARSYFIASLAEMDYIVTEDSKVDFIRQHWPHGNYQIL